MNPLDQKPTCAQILRSIGPVPESYLRDNARDYLAVRKLEPQTDPIRGQPISAIKWGTRKPRTYPESDAQREVIGWWKDACLTYSLPENVLFHVPNGRDISPIARMVGYGLGIRPGVSDLFLMVGRNGLHGLFIEMKSAVGQPSKAQLDFLAEAEKQGYAAHVCFSSASAINEIKHYLFPAREEIQP